MIFMIQIAQNGAQPIFCQTLHITCSVKKVAKNMGGSSNFLNIGKQKFTNAGSSPKLGHSDLGLCLLQSFQQSACFEIIP
jgi:hypothetical protein